MRETFTCAMGNKHTLPFDESYTFGKANRPNCQHTCVHHGIYDGLTNEIFTFIQLSIVTWTNSHGLLCKSNTAMITSSNGHIVRVTGPLWGKYTGQWWIPLTEAIDAELWCFLSALEQTVRQTTETPVIWGPLWRHCNSNCDDFALFRQLTYTFCQLLVQWASRHCVDNRKFH